MKQLLVAAIALIYFSGCRDSYDERLTGVWQSNREDTMDGFLRLHPQANLSGENLEKLSNMFGHMKLIYNQNEVIMELDGETGTFHYEVIDRGENFVVIRTFGAISDNNSQRIEFDEDYNSYWIDTGAGYSEKFDKQAVETY